MHEFELINQFFNQKPSRKDVRLSVGDDCALLMPPTNKVIATSIDTLVEDTHFFPDMLPENLGYKSLAVSLSDLAAMGATPAWVMLSLVLPKVDELWLKKFSDSFLKLAGYYHIDLIGGNTSQGPLSVTTQVTGFIDNGHVLKRDQAMPGDLIYVSGSLGGAAGALKVKQAQKNIPQALQAVLSEKWHRPKPRIELGKRLSAFSKTAIDISDGLMADLQHILNASQVGALIDVEKIPVEPALFDLFDESLALELALTGGEDYELCFTVAKEEKNAVPDDCICIGRIEKQLGLSVKYKTGKTLSFNHLGHQHF